MGLRLIPNGGGPCGFSLPQVSKIYSKQHRNFLTHTHSIPSDILAKIFIELFRMTSLNNIFERRSIQRDSVEDHPLIGAAMKETVKEGDYSWVSVMLVCRHFHDVAVSCQQLWSLVDFTAPDTPAAWKNLCMERVKGYPTTIRSCVTGRHLEDPQLSPPTQLYTSGQGIHIVFQEFQPNHDIFTGLFNRNFPHLHYLHLVIDPPILGGDRSLNITSHFLGGNATNLTRLTLGVTRRGRVRFQADGVPEFPALLLLELRNCTMDLFSLRSLLAKTTHLRSLTIKDLHTTTDGSQQPSLPKQPPAIPPFSRLKELKWTGHISLPLVREISPRRFSHFFVTLDKLKGANDGEVYAYVCDLVSCCEASSPTQGRKSLRSCYLQEGDPIDGGLLRADLAIFGTGIWPALAVKAPYSPKHFEMLFKHVSSLRLRQTGAIKIHEAAILANTGIRQMHLSLKGTCWKDVQTEVLTLENILARRAECGNKLELVDAFLSKVKQAEDKAEVAAQMKDTFARWKKEKWVKNSRMYIQGYNPNTCQPRLTTLAIHRRSLAPSPSPAL